MKIAVAIISLYYLVSLPLICLKKYKPVMVTLFHSCSIALCAITPFYLIESLPLLLVDKQNIVQQFLCILLESVGRDYPFLPQVILILWILGVANYVLLGIFYDYYPAMAIIPASIGMALSVFFPIWMVLAMVGSTGFMGVIIFKK